MRLHQYGIIFISLYITSNSHSFDTKVIASYEYCQQLKNKVLTECGFSAKDADSYFLKYKRFSESDIKKSVVKVAKKECTQGLVDSLMLHKPDCDEAFNNISKVCSNPAADSKQRQIRQAFRTAWDQKLRFDAFQESYKNACAALNKEKTPNSKWKPSVTRAQ